MTPTVAIAFAYTSDPLVLAALKEFHVFPVDPNTHTRLSTAPVIVPPTAVPSITAPLTVIMVGYGTQAVEVVPIDIQGNEGTTAYGSVHINLPPVTSIAQLAK